MNAVEGLGFYNYIYGVFWVEMMCRNFHYVGGKGFTGRKSSLSDINLQ